MKYIVKSNDHSLVVGPFNSEKTANKFIYDVNESYADFTIVPILSVKEAIKHFNNIPAEEATILSDISKKCKCEHHISYHTWPLSGIRVCTFVKCDCTFVQSR